MIIQITSRCRKVLNRGLCIEINFHIKIPYQGYGTQGFVSGYFNACMYVIMSFVPGATECNRKEIFTSSETNDEVQLQSSSAVLPYNNGECIEKVQVCLT